MFQTHTDNAIMRGTNGGKDVKYNEMDQLILDVLGKVWMAITVFRLRDTCRSATGKVTYICIAS